MSEPFYDYQRGNAHPRDLPTTNDTPIVDRQPAEHLLTTRSPCEVHQKHIPTSHVNHIHHIWPLGRGGPNIAENRITVCATGHYNIHKLLDELLASNGQILYSELKNYAFHERTVAKAGYDRIMRQAL